MTTISKIRPLCRNKTLLLIKQIKYALLTAFFFCLTGYANAETLSDKMLKAMAEISDETSKCAAMYAMLSLLLEKKGEDIEEVKEYKEKAAESLHIARATGAIVSKDEGEVMDGLMGHHSTLTRLSQLDNNEELKVVITKCLMMSADYNGFIKNRLRAAGLPEEIIKKIQGGK